MANRRMSWLQRSRTTVNSPFSTQCPPLQTPASSSSRAIASHLYLPAARCKPPQILPGIFRIQRQESRYPIRRLQFICHLCRHFFILRRGDCLPPVSLRFHPQLFRSTSPIGPERGNIRAAESSVASHARFKQHRDTTA